MIPDLLCLSGERCIRFPQKQASKETSSCVHRNGGFKLGRNTSHRRAMLRNLVTSIILNDRVETTITKCKASRPIVEKDDYAGQGRVTFTRGGKRFPT